MPNPKRKHSKQRRDKRRTHDKARGTHTGNLPELRSSYSSTTGFVPNVVIIKENLQLKKKLLHNVSDRSK